MVLDWRQPKPLLIHWRVFLQWTYGIRANLHSMESYIILRSSRIPSQQKSLHLDKIILLKTHHINQKRIPTGKAKQDAVLIFGHQTPNPFDVRFDLRSWTDGTLAEEEAELLSQTKSVLTQKPVWHLQRPLDAIFGKIVRYSFKTLLSLRTMPKEKRIHLFQMQRPGQDIRIRTQRNTRVFTL